MGARKSILWTAICFAATSWGLLGAKALKPPADYTLYPYRVGKIVDQPRVADAPEAREKGKKVYEANCARCHGVKGDGQGPISFVLEPKPRDFRRGTFKLRSTESGQLPRDEDLFHTISAGIPGSGMPSWKDKLTVPEIWQVIHYLKEFYPSWEEDLELEPLHSLTISKPPVLDQATVAQGKKLYTRVKCFQCHGDSGVGDGPSAKTLKDDWGQKIVPGNMTKPWSFRSGSRPEDIYRAFTTGLNGTPMPSFKGDLSDQERWQLVAYILSLAGKPPAPQLVEPSKGPETSHGLERASQIGSRVGPPKVIVNLQQSAWESWPKEIRVKKGQVVEIRVWSVDNGIGSGHGFAIDGYEDRIFVNGITMDSPKAIRFVADRAGEFEFYCATQCDPGQSSSSQKSTGIWGHAFMGGSFIVEEK